MSGKGRARLTAYDWYCLASLALTAGVILAIAIKALVSGTS